jgi:hypothetical protein
MIAYLRLAKYGWMPRQHLASRSLKSSIYSSALEPGQDFALRRHRPDLTLVHRGTARRPYQIVPVEAGLGRGNYAHRYCSARWPAPDGKPEPLGQFIPAY